MKSGMCFSNLFFIPNIVWLTSYQFVVRVTKEQHDFGTAMLAYLCSSLLQKMLKGLKETPEDSTAPDLFVYKLHF